MKDRIKIERTTCFVVLRIAAVMGLLAVLLGSSPAPSTAELSGNANPGTTVSASALSSFTRHACAIDLAGDLRCWGQNSHGSLGLETAATTLGGAPGQMGDNLAVVNLGTGRTVTQISTGYYHNCAILNGGDVKCWGRGAEGQLGYGDTADRGATSGDMGDNLPIVDLGTGRTAVAIATGFNHTCAVLDNGALKCWGVNGSGELGYGDTTSRGDMAGQMGDNLPAVDLGTGRTAVAVSTGLSHTCAILDNNDLKCWGTNASGELGLGAAGNRGDAAGQMGDNLPALDLGTGRTAASVSLGFSASCAILDNGDAKCWGLNVGGRLGLGDTTNRGIGATDMGDNLPAVNLGTGRTALAISAGNNHICAILDDASVKCWGEGNWGQLGLENPTALGSSPTHMGDNLPAVNIGAGETAVSLAAGDGHTCVITDSGSIKCWGYNGSGTLGIGTTANIGDGGGEMGANLMVTDLGTGVLAAGAPDPVDGDFVIMANWNVGGTVRQCEGDGAGNWTNCTSIPITDAAPDGTSSIEAGDWNSDGLNDIVVANQNGTLNSCLREAGGSWTCTSNGLNGRHRGIGVGDFNGDGNLEFVGAIETMSNMDVCIGDGIGGFTCNRAAAPNGGRDIAVYDYDGDGDLDLAYAAWPGPSAICLNDGAANFTCSAITGTADNLGVDQGDFDEDGNIDLVFGGGGAANELLCLGNGAGAFTCSMFNGGGYHSQARVGDLNGDDNLDVVVGGDGVPSRSCLGDGAGGLTCSDVAGTPTNTGAVELVHIDSDGVLDALFGSVGGVPNQSCLGLSNGQFTCSDIDPTQIHNTQGVLLLEGLASNDSDADGVLNSADNCPAVPNPGQLDTDVDLIGNACDSDDDGDGLTDNDEITLHLTDPLVPDTDADTLSDGDEINIHGTDPTLADTDTDTLPDADEINIYGTNPTLADTDTDSATDDIDNCPLISNPTQLDTDLNGVGNACDPDDDGDGLPDVDETGVWLTDPLLVDTDADTLLDGDEVNIHGTDPTLADTDADTYDDALEIANGSNPLVPPSPQAITFAQPADTSFDIGSFTVNPTAGSGLPVTLTASGACTSTGFNVTITAPGACTLSADQAGDYNWAPAPTVTNVVNVAPGVQSIIVGALPALTFGDAPFTVPVNATSGLPVSITAAGPCTVAVDVVTITGAGSCDLTFSQAGDGNWAAANAITMTLGVDQALQAITVTPPADMTFGAAAQPLAAAATSALPITMSATGPCAVAGSTIEANGAGTCTVTYEQAGDANWFAALTQTASFVILPADQVITVGAVADRFFDEGPITLTPSTPSGLPITVSVTGDCSNVGTEITPLAAGSCAVTFEQPGDTNWNPAPAESAVFTIGLGRQTINVPVPAARVFGDLPFAHGATASSGFDVTVTAAGPCSIVGGLVSIDGAGTCTLTAAQPGDANWGAAPSQTVSFVIAANTQTIALDPPAPRTFGDEPFVIEPTASSELPILIEAGGACSNDDAAISIDAAGACTITLSQEGDGNFEAAAPVTVTVAVAKATQSISVTTPTGAQFADPALRLGVTASSGLPVALQADGVCTITDGVLRYTSVGNCEVFATQGGNNDWLAAETVTITFAVAKADAEIIVITDTVGSSDEPQPAEVETRPAGLQGLRVTYDESEAVPNEPGAYELLATLDNPNYRAANVATTFTVLEPPELPEEDVAGFRFISMGVADLVDNGLPQPNGEGTVMTITGLTPGTSVSLTDANGQVRAFANDEGVAVLTIDPAFDLAEATFEVRPIAGPTLLISTEEVARMGESEIVLGFSSDEGEDTEETVVVVEGDGLAPGSGARVVVHSTPIEIGRIEADGSGAFREELVLPAGLEAGEHRVLVHADTPEGSMTGTWFFAVDDTGDLDRLGDPEIVVPEEPTVDAGEPQEDPPAALAATDEEIAQEDIAPESSVEEIDEATGLPVYDPVEDPVQTVDSGVNGFTIVTVVTAAAGSMAALGSITPATGGLGGGGSGLSGSSAGASAASSSRSTATTSRRSDSSTGESEESRSKGKIASGKTKGLGSGVEAVAWGDASATWRWPLVLRVDQLSRELPDRLRTRSPLLARVTADGSTMRAMFGSTALFAPAFGAALGLLAVIQTGGDAVAPTLGLMLALILLGILDASAGFTAAVVFAIGVTAAGGISSADSVRTVMGVGSLWYAVPLIAGGARKFRRPSPDTWGDRWERFADVAIGSLLGAWAVQTVLKALPGLSGVALPISERADQVALMALAALVGRYLFETLAISAYPERMAMTAPIEESEPGYLQQVLSVILKAAVFVFVIEPYIGLVWQLGVVVALMVVPSGLGIIKDRFPNKSLLNRMLPSGVPAILFFMVVGKTLGEAISNRIDDPATLTMTTFIVLSIPGFLSSVAGLFGRDSKKIGTDWFGRFAGLSVVVVTFLTIRGYVSAPPLSWIPFAVAPAFVWWLVKATRTELEDPPEDEEAEDAEDADMDEDATEDAADSDGSEDGGDDRPKELVKA